MDPWRMTFDEYQKYAAQFAALKPLNGFLNGEQARAFFLQFNLPTSVLAQIWNLADLTSDGRLDRREFGIAMHLLSKSLAGRPLPAILPDSLKIEPTQSHQAAATTFTGSSSIATPFVAPTMSSGAVALPPKSASSRSSSLRGDWTIPSQSRLRYSQAFNSMDRNRTGFLSGVQARNILTQTGLPTEILVRLWDLADADKDGRLSCDEYCVAMFLVDKLKSGEVSALPAQLPPETFIAHPGRQRTISINSLGSQDFDSISMDSTLASINSGSRFAVSFEERRRENFDKGQAELERRRLILLEQEKREKEERERKEREEAERQLRERLEVERKRQIELELLMAKQREEEARREEEYRKTIEQRETARRELERQRQVELERQRLHELIIQRQNEQESVCHLRQKQKHLQFDLQGLTDKTAELNSAITNVREQIVSVTSTIELMKQDRDAKMSDIDSNKRQIQELNSITSRNQLELKSLADQQSRLKTGASPLVLDVGDFSAARRQKSMELESLRLALADIEREISRQSTADASTTSESESVQSREAEMTQNRQLIAKISLLRQQLAEKRSRAVAKRAADVGVAAAAPAMATSAESTAKYRALYEFAARGEDELSFQPGDIILVFKSHSGEPGWLAGQIKDKVGWFPESFAEPMDNPAVADPFIDSSPHHIITKLESIHEESTDKDSEIYAQIPSKIQTNGSVSGLPAQIAVAQFQWKAKKDNHLSFNKGDVIKVLEMQEMWWLGELAGHTGWFPKSYVKLVDASELNRRKSDDSLSDRQQVSRDKVQVLSQKFDSQEFPSQHLVDKNSHPDPFLDGAGPAIVETSSLGQWHVALYPFPEMEPGDLQFEAGERIFVTQKDGEWWTGECNGRTGMFPANYVEPVPPPEPTHYDTSARATDEYAQIVKKSSIKSSEKTSPIETVSPTSPRHHEVCEVVKAIAPFQATGANQLSLEEGDWIKIRSKSPTGWWEGELCQKKDKQVADKLIGWFPGNYVTQVDKKQQFQGQKSTSADSSKQSDYQQNETVIVMFDYAAQQDDELSLKRGERVSVLERIDDDWWQGETASGQRGLFPATYVRPISVNERSLEIQESSEAVYHDAIEVEERNLDSMVPQEPNSDDKAATKRAMYCHELLQTERNFVDDLLMVRQVFYKQIQESSCLTPEELKQLFLNWDDLIKGSKTLFKALKHYGENRIGCALLKSRSVFDAFLVFCHEQQSSLDLLENKIKTCKKFQTIHSRCSQHPAARGLPLNHFLLIPISRVTKYPLVLKEILKYTPEQHEDKLALSESLDFLKNLCDQVDKLANETQNLQMLHWCQNHVRCESLQPKLIFNGETNCSGWRKILHSGIVFKAKSNRLLLGLLFNDLLMFTTPDDSIDKPMDFKLTCHSEFTFSLYKQPILLRKANLQLPPNLTGVESGDDTLFALNTGESIISLKALSSNNRLLWIKQLEKAIKQAKQDYAGQHCPLTPEGASGAKTIPSKHTIGRLLMDVVSLKNLHIPAPSKSYHLFLVLSVGDGQRFIKRIDGNNESVRGDYGTNFGPVGVSTPANALVSTQFLLEDTSASFELKVYIEHYYAPNICVGQARLPVEDMLRMSGSHKNPAIKQLPLRPLEAAEPISNSRGSEGPGGHVVIKFVVQMLDVA